MMEYLRSRGEGIALLMILCAFLAPSVLAQTAELSGFVRDTSGAVVTKATVKAVSTSTGRSQTANSDESGLYRFSLMQPGVYDFDVTANGFQKQVRSGVRLHIGDRVQLDFVVEVETIQSSVTVEADGGSMPAVSGDSPTVSSLVDSRQLQAMPLNGRSLDRAILLVAGNVGSSADQPRIGGTPPVGGSFWTVDGIPYQDVALGRAVPTAGVGLGQFPSLDNLEEVKIESSLAKAEHDGPVPISILTKAGTNEFHGSVFWFNRNREFSARPFFLNAATPKPVFNRNEFGAVIGGPVIRNRTFFQFSYEGMRRRTASSVALSVAPQALRDGDFGGLDAVLDPLSGVPFANNRIPVSRLDARSRLLQDFVPLPNAQGTGPAGTGVNYYSTVGEFINHDKLSLRIDHYFNERHSLTSNLNHSDSSPTFAAYGGPANFGNLSDTGRRTKTGSLALNSSFHSTLHNEFRYSYFMNMEMYQGQNTDFNPATIFPSLYQPLTIGGLPTVSITGYQGVRDFGGASGYAPQITNQFSDNLTKTFGSHALKAGFTAAWVRQSRPPNTEPPAFGSFTFNGRYTNNPYADFLLGHPVSTSRSQPSLISLLHYGRFGAFVQDDWKMHPQLTLSFGLRIVSQSAPAERDGNMSNFDPVTGTFVVRSVNGEIPSMSIPRIMQAYPIGKSEDIGWGSNLMVADKANYAPRLGFAWRPFGDGRTVVRGGYGVYYSYVYHGYGLFGTFFANPPFMLSETFEANAGTTPSLSLANPFPGTGAIGSNPRLLAIQRDLKLGVSQQWNLTVERELSPGLGVRISYIGNKGQNLTRSQSNWNLPAVQAPGTIQSQRPYQPWSDIPVLLFDGQSITHQMQTEVTQRYRNGFMLQASYTWNKSLDNLPNAGITQNPRDYRADRGNSDGIRHHAFYATALYELPFGSGKALLSSDNTMSRMLIGGWSLSGSAQLLSGSPFSIGFTPTQAGWYANRADVVPGADLYPENRSAARWFNPDAFRTPQPFTFGNSARNMLIGPGSRSVDVAVLKDFTIRENLRLQFRAEAFNVTNSVSLGTPAANISTPQNVGVIRSSSVPARNIQFGLKVIF